MLLKLDVLASTTIKRKKPWPKLAWLGKDVGDLFLFDSHRISQLYFPSGKTKKKIPLLQSYLEDVQCFGISPNGLFVVGALNSGRIFIWNKRSATVTLTAVLDKIRNVQPGTRHTTLLQLNVSDCGRKVLLLSGFRQVFLWETQGNDETVNGVQAVGDTLRGVWLQIQCGTYILPDEKDKETAIDGVFFVDPVSGTSCSLSWVFNKSDKIHVTTLHLLWPPEKNYSFPVDSSSNQEGSESPFTATWRTFKHSLYNLTPAERVIKKRKAYIARVSPDGQIMVIAMNQKFAAHNRIMFYSLSQSAVAVIADLKGCGARLNVSSNAPMGRSWWVSDMSWTRDSLLVLCITRRGSVAILSKLGEPVEICTEGCSLHTGPALFLPLHPKISFQSRDAIQADSSESCASERDPLTQRFSVSVHPHLPVILSSDGYLVTLMQLPPVANYHGVMTGFMRDVTRLVPDVDVEIQTGNLSRVSSMSRINILQSEANISRGVTSTEFLSDAPSENNSTGSSTVVPGYGLASGDQGFSFFGLSDPELESSLPEYEPGSLDAISHAQGLSVMALALGSACGVNWKREVGPAMDATVNVVMKLFQLLLRGSENTTQLRSHTKALSPSFGDLTKRRSSSPVADSQLSRALSYFRMVLEVFQWDSCHRNVFAWAFHLTHGVVREILLLRDASVVYRVTCSLRVLKLAERVLNLVYSLSNPSVVGVPSSGPESELVGQESEQVKHGSEQISQGTGQVKQEFGQSKRESGVDKQESELVKQETKQVEQELSSNWKEEDLEKDVSEGGSLGKGNNEFNSQSQQQSMVQSNLSGSWLLLYNFTSESCKKMQKRRTSLFSAEEGEGKTSAEKKMVELLCEIQEKLQTLGVRIPANACTEKEDVESVSAYLDGTHQSLLTEGPQESMFSRRRSSLQGPTGQMGTPEASRRYGSPYRDAIEREQARDTPSRLSPAGIPSGGVNEQDSKTLLSILYLQLQQYNLRSALDLIYSLIEPAFSCEQLESNQNFSFLSNAQVSSRPSNVNHSMDVLLQNYPIARVADKRGLEAVQTLARFMAAYFSNLSLYVFPPYQPVVLPAFHEQQSTTSSGLQRKEHSQAMEHFTLDRAKIAQAVRDQGLYELWSANSALELLLVSGLVSEGAWLARNLGDWKNAMLLSFADGVLTSRVSRTSTDSRIQAAFPVPPNDIKPNLIAMSRLLPAFKEATCSGEEKTGSIADDKIVYSTTAKINQRTKQSVVDPGTDVDDKVVKEVSRILEAGVVAGLDLVPIVLTKLLVQLKKMASMFVWIVPEEFYLPYPPAYCPQPINSKKDPMSPAAEKEEKIRSEISVIVQRILLLLTASHCLVPCVRWYTEQLISTTESWCKVDRSDSEFPVPSSLAGYADRGLSFHESHGYASPKKKGKSSSEVPPSGKQEKWNENLPSPIATVMGCFRDFCAVTWLLHARDKMSKSSRKYRQLRSQSSGSDEEANTIQSICWETLLWTTRLVPFSSFLGAEDKINDTLLTLLSELPLTVATAELTAQFFNDPEVVQTTSGRAKFKRLMAQFRGASLQDSDGSEEPLSVIYRKKCMEWEEELSEREKLFGKVSDQFFPVDDAHENDPTYGRTSDERATNGRSAYGGSFDEGAAVARQENQVIAVGTAPFETESSYFQFLDTFFMITVSKTMLAQPNKAPYPIPLLSSYSKHLLAADTKSLVALQQRAHSDAPAKPIKASSSLFRSQSFTDVRSSRSKPDVPAPRSTTGADIKRSSSMNDVAKLGSLPGIQTLGSLILDLLPSLTWLSRWTLEGSSLPSSNFNLSAGGPKESLPVMRVHVPLPLLVNGLWLLQNVYWPWVSNAEVVVDIKVIRRASPPKQLHDTTTEHSPSLQGAATPPKGLRKVLSDSNIQKTADKSLKRNSTPRERSKYRLGVDYHHQSTPDMFEKSQGEVKNPGYGVTESSRRVPVQTRQEHIQLARPLRKDLRAAQQLDRIPKSNSEPNIPNIVVQSPTTDEEKDISGALKTRHTLVRGNGRSHTTYHSDTELSSPAKPIVTSTPAESKRLKKTKRRERRAVEIADEDKAKVTSGSDGDASEKRTQHRHVKTTEDLTSAPQQSAETTKREQDTHSQPTIRTAPPRQGKRKKKPSAEKTVVTVDGNDSFPKVKDSIGDVVASDSRRRNTMEQNKWSQSSATEAVVSQGQMELLLVVRPGDSREPTTLQTSIPLLRIPTVVDSSQSSEVTSHRETTAKTETASQTDRQTLASSASQTQGHVNHQPDQQGLTSYGSQTLQPSGIPSEQDHLTRNRDDQRLTSLASQTPLYSGIPSEQGRVLRQTAHTVSSQTNPSTEPKPTMALFPLLLPQQQAPILQMQLPNATSNSQPTATQHQNHPLTSTSRNLPLLRFPTADPGSQLDLSKMRLLEIPKRSGDSPFLHFPESKASSSQPTVPDLSKIKFLEIQPKKEIWPNTAESKGHGSAHAPPKNWPLLRMTASQGRSNRVDFRKMRLCEHPPVVREAWPLLETPTKAVTPKLIPLDKILAFEKGIRDKLTPFGEAPSRYPHEKENIRPPVENKPVQMQPRLEPNNVTEPEDNRNTASRQKRRQALEKQTRPRSTSPLNKVRRRRATSRGKSLQGKAVIVQPAKKARKGDKGFTETNRQESEPVTKKSRPNVPQMARESDKKKEKNESVSLSESELDLSEISDHALDVSEEEEYFRIERSPEPFTLIDEDHRQPSKSRGEGRERDHRITNKEREHTEPRKVFEDVVPGPPSMRHIRERIGRKLHDVDQQMAAYRSGSGSFNDETRGGRQAGHGSVRQQNTVGVQVSEQNKPSPGKSVAFFLSDSPDRLRLGNTFKVSSSSQTDQPLPRSPPTRKDPVLVTSGVQTEKDSSDSDHVMSHAPALPPDIFLNLQLPRAEQDGALPPESVLDYYESEIEQPASIRGRQVGVGVGGPPPVRPVVGDQASTSFPVDVRGRQFLSVADIDHDQWLEVQSTPIAATDEGKIAEMKEMERKEEERGRSGDAETEILSRKVRESPKSESDEDVSRDQQETEMLSVEGADRVTVEMMDSTDIPVQRFYPLPFPTTSQSGARAVTTHALKERMKEMNERIEAMDEITQNMDREFKSSRVLLSAIQSIDEVLNPSSTEVKSSSGSQGSRRGMPRRWGDTAPWRKKPRTSREQRRLHQTEDVEDSIDVDKPSAEKEATVDTAEDKNDSDNEESVIEGNDELANVDADIDEADDHRSLDQQQEHSGGSIEHQSSISLDDNERESEEGRGKEQEGEDETGEKSSIDQEDVQSTASQDRRKRDGKAFDPLESLSLPQDKLKEILNEKEVKRTRDTSPEAREELKEWMNKKRLERQADWKNQKEELRAQEHQPFMSPTQGSATFKKIKLMEKERDVKRRKTEDQHTQKRIESASNLLSEMLAEPVPKPKDQQPNLRYGTTVNSRYSKPAAPTKKNMAERRKKLPKGSLKKKQKLEKQVENDTTAFQKSIASTKENYSLPNGTYRTRSLFPEDMSKTSRSQTTPRHDIVRTRSPIDTGEQVFGGLDQENIVRNEEKFVQKGKTPDDDFWRSKSPTGAEFVTTRTYQKFAKNQGKRLKARDAALRKTPPGGLTGYGLPSQPRGVAGLERTYARTQPTNPLLPGGETLLEIDRLLDDDDDDGFILDQEKLDGIESLLEGDEELRDLLSDVDWRGVGKRADSKRPAGHQYSLFGGRGRNRDGWPSKVGGDHRTPNFQSAGPSSSGISRNFDLDVSPWNTGQSLRTSDDVAQLLADVDEAVGNMSESTGSTRSHIDWEEVDKIMGEA